MCPEGWERGCGKKTGEWKVQAVVASCGNVLNLEYIAGRCVPTSLLTRKGPVVISVSNEFRPQTAVVPTVHQSDARHFLHRLTCLAKLPAHTTSTTTQFSFPRLCPSLHCSALSCPYHTTSRYAEGNSRRSYVHSIHSMYSNNPRHTASEPRFVAE